MDPQAALNYARKAASDILDDMDHERATDPDDVQRLAESFQALDGWLSREGFLPSDWERATPDPTEEEGPRVLRCRDCEHPLHQMAEKALSGEYAMVWADQDDDWVCDVTGDEHRPGVTS
jgi:hypothetical protein